MQQKWPGKDMEQVLRPLNILHIIENEYHQEINEFCNIVSGHLLQESPVEGLELSVSELLHLLVTKLCDEIKHQILKENGIIFPIIRRDIENSSTKTTIGKQVFESIKNRHFIITELLSRIRILLEQYRTVKGLNGKLRKLLDDLTTLEQKVHDWISLEHNILFPQLTGRLPMALAN